MPFLKLKTVIIIIWMFHSLSLNNKINRFHERSLGIIYSDKRSIFEELLAKDYSVSVHHKNIHATAIQITNWSMGFIRR